MIDDTEPKIAPELLSHFEHVLRDTDEEGIWAHRTKPMWIVHYPARFGFALETWRVYYCVAPVPAGRKPWSIDNRALNRDGYPSLEAAMEAAA